MTTPHIGLPAEQVLAAAAFIIRRLIKLGPVEPAKVQRLLYYANAWHLVKTGDPLFEDDIEAWPHGPVVEQLHPLMREPLLFEELSVGDPDSLSPTELAHIDWTVDTYGGLSGYRLSNLARTESPWLDSWSRMDPADRQGVIIPHAAMKDFYRAQRAGSVDVPHT